MSQHATESIHGAESVVLDSPELRLAISLDGGMLAPAEFHLPGRTVSPYALAPWLPDEVDAQLPPLLRFLRGDFFCLPFGPQLDGPPHGAPANDRWKIASQDARSCRLSMTAADSGARVEKSIHTHPGHSAIYFEHVISGLKGDFSYGTHPVLALPTSGVPARLSVSNFRWGSVYPTAFSDPAEGAHQALKPAARFSSLHEVPLAASGNADLTRQPALPAADDLVMCVNSASSPNDPFAWSACVMDGYVWIALKDPKDFPATLIWMSHGGRSAAPWQGRHTHRIGIEEVCSYFCDSVTDSRRDLLAAENIRCTRTFVPDRPVRIAHLHAVAAVPPEFDLVTEILPNSRESIRITSASGASIGLDLDWQHVLARDLTPIPHFPTEIHSRFPAP